MRGACLAGAWVAATASAAVLVIAGAGAWPLALAAHAVTAVLAGLGFGARKDDRFFYLSLTLALPFLGVVAFSALALATRLLGAPRPAPLHPSGADLPEPEAPRESMDRVFDWLQAQLAVQPLADVLRSGDPAMQRWAIQRLGKRTDAVAVELLREALTAEDRDVQIAATTTLQRIEERLADAIGRAGREAAEAEDSAAACSILGDACRAYQESGLLESVMVRHWLARAEEAYRRALALEPGRPPTVLALARVLVRLGRAAEAEAFARAAVTSAPSVEADQLLAEVLFEQARWTELREVCRSAVAAGRRSEPLVWWTETPAS